MKKCVRNFLIVVWVIAPTFVGGQAWAQNYYSVTAHRVKEGFKTVTLSSFEDEASCRETAEARNSNMDAKWILESSRCISKKDLKMEEAQMFERKTLSDPYVIFSDQNGIRNVVYFQNVPPVVIDVMVWKWAEGLTRQNLKEVTVIVDPSRQKMKNLYDGAKAKIAEMAAWKKEKPVLSTPPAEPAKAAFVKKDKLILKSGAVIEGNLLERRKDGYWFQVEEGLELLFSDMEVKSFEKSN